MTRCAKCGKDVADGSSFCTACGEKLSNVQNNIQDSTISQTNTNEAITAAMIEKLLIYLRQEYFSDFFQQNEKWLTKYGLLGLYIVALLGLISSFVLPIRNENLSFAFSIGIGFIWFFSAIVVHYTAWKFLPALQQIIDSTPTKLSSKAFLDCLALISGIIGVAALVGGLYLWVKTSSVGPFVGGIFAFISCEYFLSLCLNPHLMNIELTEKTTAGEEFLGLISFFMKGFLKIIPIIFGSGIIFGLINLVILLFSKVYYIPILIGELISIAYMMAVALLPIIGYFIFLTYYFFMDLAMAVLVIPSKLDSLKENR